MNPPRLESCYFEHSNDGRWARMARVLRSTAAKHCPSWRINVQAIAPKLLERGKRSEACNTAKLEHWNDVIQRSADGDRVLLLDADTFILRSLDPIWDQAFDFAYTVRPSMFPLNGGVVFVRVWPKVRAFFAAWLAENKRLIEDNADQRQPWRQQFGGINQAALGKTMPAEHGLRVLTLPCLQWNCEDTTWMQFDPAVTRIVHVKSALRMACIETQPIPAHLAQLAAMWKACEKASRSQIERAS